VVLLVEFAPPQTVVEIGFPQPEEQTGLIGRAVEGSFIDAVDEPEIGRDNVVEQRTVNKIDALDIHQRVGSLTERCAGDHDGAVVLQVMGDLVATAFINDRIGTRTAVDIIVTKRGVDDVIAFKRQDLIVELGAVEDVLVRRAKDGPDILNKDVEAFLIGRSVAVRGGEGDEVVALVIEIEH